MAIKWEVLSADWRNNSEQVPTLLKADVGAFELRLSSERWSNNSGSFERWTLTPVGGHIYADSLEVAKIEAEERFVAALRTALRIAELPESPRIDTEARDD